MEVETAQLKVGDIISQIYDLGTDREREVLRVVLTKVNEEIVEGYILLSDYETWGQENIGETFRMAQEHYYPVWSNNRNLCYWRVL